MFSWILNIRLDMNNICCSFRIFEDIPTNGATFIPKKCDEPAIFIASERHFSKRCHGLPFFLPTFDVSRTKKKQWFVNIKPARGTIEEEKGRYKLVIACASSTYWWVLESFLPQCLLDIFGSFSILRIFLPFLGEVAFVSLSVAANAVLGLNFGQQGINFTMPLLCIKIFDLFAAHSVDLEISKSQIWRPKRGEISPKRLRTQLIAR